MIKWSRFNGYEISSKGDNRFSAFNAYLPDGRTIEQHYQCDVKGYDIGGVDWRLGKGKPPINGKTKLDLWQEYLNLWRLWSKENINLLRELYIILRNNPQYNYCLSDRFATTDINQAHALSVIINELIESNKSSASAS